MSRSTLLFSVVSLGLLLLSGCLFDTTLSPADYDRSCTVDSDCTIVWGDGDVCLCPAPMAINVSAEPKFYSDADRLQSRCRAMADCAAPNYTPVATCQANTCTVIRQNEGGDADAGTADVHSGDAL